MKGSFKIVGMSTPRSFACHTDNGSIFWAKSGLSEEKYKELFKWAKADDDFWKQQINGTISFESISNVDGVPINGVLESIEIN